MTRYLKNMEKEITIENQVEEIAIIAVKKGQHFSMKSDKIRPSDKLYKLVSTEELKKFKGLDIEQKRG